MKLTKSFSDEQLNSIINEAFIYMCACPAQVAKEVLNLRCLFIYQESCLLRSDADGDVHRGISEAVIKSHAILETCLSNVLAIEKWDLVTLTMPPNLRALRDSALKQPVSRMDGD